MDLPGDITDNNENQIQSTTLQWNYPAHESPWSREGLDGRHLTRVAIAGEWTQEKIQEFISADFEVSKADKQSYKKKLNHLRQS